ncbi:MAG: patatin-like phospholipase family protein [Opitutaceae bacterium]|nr:patatin-like phospholipase family protein [Opitutaceae bacterium]
MSPQPPKDALLLAGGGARGAYQVGVLRSLARAFPDLNFPIVTGVSAGAINAATLANTVEPFPMAVERLAQLWESLTLEQVFRSDFRAVGAKMLNWTFRLLSGGAHLTPSTRGMVDTEPLRRFLSRVLDTPDGVLHGVAENIRRGRLSAVGIMTTQYPTAQSVTWAQGAHVQPWQSAERSGVNTTLTVEHIMGSSSLPLVFPAAKIDGAWHGDGGIRLTSPLSPAVSLGADRIIAISTSVEPGRCEADRPTEHYPPPATVISVLLESVFLDMLDTDASELRRMNQLIAEHPKSQELGLRRVDALVLRPSQDLSVIASEFEPELPRVLRHVIRGLGSLETNRSDMIATLLFQPLFIRKMLEIGEHDGEKRIDEIATFLGRAPVGSNRTSGAIDSRDAASSSARRVSPSESIAA